MNIRYLNLFIIIFFLQSSVLYAQNLRKHYSLSLTDYSKYKKDFYAFDYVNINAPKKGEINIGVVGNYDSINNNILLGNAAAGLELIYDSLMQKSLDELATAYMLIAEYMQFSEETNEVIFKIRDNAYWHNNSPITNHDILFTFNILRKEGHPYYKITFKDILSARILNNNKIAFKFIEQKNPDKPSIDKSSIDKDLVMKIGTMPIISKSYYQNHKFNQISLVPPLSNGPYKIKELKAGKYIIYERVKNYWAKELNINRGRHNFDLIKYSYYRDANIAILGLKAGEYDLRFENIAKNWAKSYQGELLESKKLIKTRIEHQIPTGMQAFIFNNRLKKFSNIKVREALLLAFDYEWTNKNLFYDAYKRTNSFFSNSAYEGEDKLAPIAQEFLYNNLNKDNNLYEKLYKLPITDASGNNRKNLILAKKLLAEAGWKIQDFILKDKNGNKFTIEFLITSRSFQRVILPYIKNLKKLGIEANIRMVDYSQYQKQVENFDFEVTVKVFPGMNIPGNEQMNLWHSKYAGVSGSHNLAGIKNPLIDKLLIEILQQDKFKNKKHLLKLLDRILRNNYYVLPHWHLNAFRLVYWNKFAFPKNNPPYGLSLDSWWSLD